MIIQKLLYTNLNVFKVELKVKHSRKCIVNLLVMKLSRNEITYSCVDEAFTLFIGILKIEV